MKKNGSAILIQQLIAVVAAMALTLTACLVTLKGSQDPVPSMYYDDLTMPEDTKSVMDSVSFWGVNCEIRKNRVLVDKEIRDARLYIDVTGVDVRRVRTVELTLEEPFAYDCTCILFYPDREGKNSEKQKDEFVLPKGKTHIYFEMPGNISWRIQSLRVDIDDDYAIHDIRMAEDLPVSEYTPGSELRRKSILLFFLIALAAAECIVFYWDFLRWPKGAKPKRRRFALKQLFFPAKVTENTEDVQSDRLTRSAIYWFLMLLFAGLIYFEYHEYRWKAESAVASFRWVYLAAFLTCAAFSIIAFRVKAGLPSDTLRSTYALLLFVMGIGYMLIFLPYVSPDETTHYECAYRVSNVLLGNVSQIDNPRLIMRREDYELFREAQKLLSEEYYLSTAAGARLLSDGTGSMAVGAPMVSNAVFSYLPTGIGIALGRILHLGALYTFCAGLLMNLLAFVLIIRHLLKITPYGRTAIFVLASLPMSLHMAASYSYDVTTFCLTALFVVQVARLMSTGKRASVRDIALCVLYAILMAPSKLVYFPLLFMAFLIPGRKIARNHRGARRVRWLIIGAGLISLIFIMLFVNVGGDNGAIAGMLKDSRGDAVKMVAWAAEPGYTVSWVLHNPVKFLGMCVRTVISLQDNFFFGMLGSNLGWLTIPTSTFLMVIFFCMFLFAVNMREEGEREVPLRASARLWIVILCLASMGLTFLAMLLDWTPVSSDFIQGCQGRYFLPLLVPAIFLLRTNMIEAGRRLRKLIVTGSFLLNIWILVYVFTQAVIGK